MAGSATTYLERAVLRHTLNIANYTMPTGIFVALDLATPPPSASAAGQEVAGGAYARVPAAFVLGGGNTASNTATLEWAAATAAWGTLGYFELWDAASGGNRLYWGPLVDPSDGVTPITPSIFTGDIMRIQAGGLVVSAF